MLHFLLKWSLFGRHVNFRGGRILFCWILAGFLLHRWNEQKFEEGFLLLDFVATWCDGLGLCMSLVLLSKLNEGNNGTAYMDV